MDQHRQRRGVQTARNTRWKLELGSVNAHGRVPMPSRAGSSWATSGRNGLPAPDGRVLGTCLIAGMEGATRVPSLYLCTCTFTVKIRSPIHDVALVIHATFAAWVGVGRNGQRLLGGSGEWSHSPQSSGQVAMVRRCTLAPRTHMLREEEGATGSLWDVEKVPPKLQIPGLLQRPCCVMENDVVQRHFGLFGRRPGHHSDSIQK